MRTRVLLPCSLLAALLVCPGAHAEDDAAWEAYFASTAADDVPEALDDPEFDRPIAGEEAAATQAEAEAEAKKESRGEEEDGKRSKRSRRSRRSEASKEKAEAEKAASEEPAEAEDASAETSEAPAAAAPGPEAVDEALALLGASTSPGTADAEPLLLFDQAESGEQSFPWGRWIAINLCLAVMLGGAVYGMKKGKLAHWLKRARLPSRAARVAPDLDVVATHSLSHGQAIHLIQGDDFRLVVGSWPGGMARLATLSQGAPGVAELPDEPEVAVIPDGAGMTEDDEAETDVMAALPEPAREDEASEEVALASGVADVQIDVGTYDSWFDNESSADDAGDDDPITVDDGDTPTVKELRFPDALRRAAAMALNKRTAAEDDVRTPATPVERRAPVAAGPSVTPRTVGVFQAGAAVDEASDPDHETLAEQVLAQVRELRGAR